MLRLACCSTMRAISRAIRRNTLRSKPPDTSMRLAALRANWLAWIWLITLKGLPSLADVRPFLAEGWQSSPAYSYVVPLDVCQSVEYG